MNIGMTCCYVSAVVQALFGVLGPIFKDCRELFQHMKVPLDSLSGCLIELMSQMWDSAALNAVGTVVGRYQGLGLIFQTFFAPFVVTKLPLIKTSSFFIELHYSPINPVKFVQHIQSAKKQFANEKKKRTEEVPRFPGILYFFFSTPISFLIYVPSS